MTSVNPAVLPALAHVEGILAGFSTRQGGHSHGPFASLNVGLNTGDEEALVQANRRSLFFAAGMDVNQVAAAGQIHGDRVKFVEEPGVYPECDGLFTTTPGIALTISAADCAAVLLADANARVIAACHSGWRGTVANIVSRTVDAMRENGAMPEHIAAFVGPCICAANFEVGPEVAAQFDSRYVTEPVAGGRPHVDLKAVLKDQLIAAGLRDESIEISPFCTFERTDLFFSYRAEGGTTGRMCGFIMLQEPA